MSRKFLLEQPPSGAAAATDVQHQPRGLADEARDFGTGVVVVLRIVRYVFSEMRFPESAHGSPRPMRGRRETASTESTQRNNHFATTSHNAPKHTIVINKDVCVCAIEKQNVVRFMQGLRKALSRVARA